MRKVFFLILLFSISLTAKSQVDIYAIGGNNASFYNYDFSMGYYSGMMVDYSLKNRFGFQFGTQFSSIKVNTTNSIYVLSTNYQNGCSAEFQYIETPLSLTYKILISESSAIKLNVGGYCAFAIGGESYYRNLSGEVKYIPSVNIAENFLYGILTGVGYNKNNLLFGVEMNFNLHDYNVPTYVLKTKLGIKF
jgi:hypothetical protein